MKITDNNHLCYSLNVYPGTSWDQKMAIFTDKVSIIRQKLNAADKPFGIGLWLDAQSAIELTAGNTLAQFKQFLAEHNLYVFTVNAFPYGSFHGERVKEQVYAPDWTCTERVDYTCRVADILAELIPQEIVGSISTVPGSYKAWIDSTDQLDQIADNIAKTALYLKHLHKSTGKQIALSIEMEPDCLWESPDQFISFYQSYFSGAKQSCTQINTTELSPYIGVCYDTCHQELIENAPGEGLKKLIKAGITISKIQLSAVLAAPTLESKSCLKELFHDQVYLHQTRTISKNSYIPYPDLLPALDAADRSLPWIIHFHLPIYLQELMNQLQTEKSELLAVIEMLRENPALCSNLEIETYTYAVLPDSIKAADLETSIAREYQWFTETLLPTSHN